MEQLLQLNMGHLVLRPHPNDLNIFEDQITIVENFIKKKKTIDFFSINVEYGDKYPSGKHLDIILFSKSKIDTNILNEKGKQKNLKGTQRDWILKVNPEQKAGNTIVNKYWNYKNVKEEDYKFVIGYSHKEQEKHGINLAQNLPEDLNIKEMIEYYKNNKPEEIETNNYMDIVPLHSKNVTNLMLNFIRDENISNIDKDLQILSMKKGYCWLDISPQKTKKLIHQIKVMRNEETQYDVEQIIKNQEDFTMSDIEHLSYVKNSSQLIRLMSLYSMGLLKEHEIEKLSGISIEEIAQKF